MKTNRKFSALFLLLMLLALLALTVQPAHAQFSAARNTPALSGTPTTVFIVPGSTTTNIPSTLQVACPIGSLGFGLTVNMAGTNSVTTTNATFIFEVSGDGANYATNNLPTFLVSPPATAYFPYYTNVINTSPCIGNAAYVRLRSIQNTNLASIFITNLSVSFR